VTGVIFPWIGGAALAGCAVFFAEPLRTYALTGLLLFFPLLDRRWRLPAIPRDPANYAAWSGLILTAAVLLLWRPQHLEFALSTLLTAALPEEWFFRAYFMTRLQETRCKHPWCANIITTIVFCGLHGLTRGWMVGLSVLVPSLFYGWLYQRTRDLPLLVLVHALSNLMFILFLGRWLTPLMKY
jgi:membrane protease YdiL (CAAX protease family)